MLGVLTLCMAAGGACKDDDKPGKPGGILSGGRGGAGGAGGGAAGSAGRAGSAGMAPTAPPPVQCGTSQCRQTRPQLEGFVLQMPCCVDEAQNLCGWTPPGGSGECTAPPPVVDECPPLGNGQQGCCIEELDRCGIDGSEYAEACYNIVESMFATPDMVPRTCDGVPVGGTEADGGVPEGDAGVAPVDG